MEELRKKISNALYATLDTTTVNTVTISNLLSMLLKRYSYTFLSRDVINLVYRDIYGEQQDNYLEFVSEFHYSLLMEGLDNTALDNIVRSSASLLNNSYMDRTLLDRTNLDISNKEISPVLCVLYLLRLNAVQAYNYINNKG